MNEHMTFTEAYIAGKHRNDMPTDPIGLLAVKLLDYRWSYVHDGCLEPEKIARGESHSVLRYFFEDSRRTSGVDETVLQSDIDRQIILAGLHNPTERALLETAIPMIKGWASHSQMREALEQLLGYELPAYARYSGEVTLADLKEAFDFYLRVQEIVKEGPEKLAAEIQQVVEAEQGRQRDWTKIEEILNNVVKG